MRVLRVIPSMNPSIGGPCQGIRNSIPELKKLGIDNEIVSFDDPEDFFLKNDNFKTHAIGLAKGVWNYNTNFIKWLNDNIYNYDIIIIHGLWKYHSYAVMKLVNSLKKTINANRLPFVFVMPHGMLDPWFQQSKDRKLKAIRNWFYWKFIEKKIINNADAILFTCEEELLLARNTFSSYNPRKELNIGYGIIAPPSYNLDMELLYNENFFELKSSPYILFISRIDIKKGVDLLIKSYQKLKKLGKGLPKLVIAGPGLESTYGKQMQLLASNDKDIIFSGMLTGDAKWSVFYNCEAFILPSHQENFGIAIVEAMACKKPVLITNKINIWREIESGGGGVVADDTLDGINDLLNKWVDMSCQKRQSMANNAYETFKSNFSIKQSALKTSIVLNKELIEFCQITLVSIKVMYQDLSKFSVPPSFRGRSKITIQLWWIIQSTIFGWSPQVLYGWRNFLLRIFGAKIGKKVLVRSTAKITYPWNLEIGNNSWVGDDCVLYNLDKITIGNNVALAHKVYLNTGGHDYQKETFDIFAKPVIIEDECWITNDVYIAPGVIIGKGTIIGARSSVFKSMPSNKVCFGSPAVPIKDRIAKKYTIQTNYF